MSFNDFQIEILGNILRTFWDNSRRILENVKFRRYFGNVVTKFLKNFVVGNFEKTKKKKLVIYWRNSQNFSNSFVDFEKNLEKFQRNFTLNFASHFWRFRVKFIAVIK